MPRNYNLLNEHATNLIFRTNEMIDLKVQQVLKINKGQVIFICNDFWHNECEAMKIINVEDIAEIYLQ